MTVLLSSCFMSYAQSDTCNISSTGGQECNDSVLIPLDLIKVANGKMIELEYEKEINKNLVEIVHNDSIIIDVISDSLNNTEIRYKEEIKRVKKQRNVIGGSLGATTAVSIILLIIALL